MRPRLAWLAAGVRMLALGGSGKSPPGNVASSSAPAASATETVDLAAMLSPYADAYGFDTRVTVGNKLVSEVLGRRIGSSTAMSITTNGVTAQQIITANGSWAREQGQAGWTAIAPPAATIDPMAALRTPKTAKIERDQSISAVYDASAFGLPAGDLPVRIYGQGGRLQRLHYETTASGQTAAVDTNFSVLTDLTPIIAPS